MAISFSTQTTLFTLGTFLFTSLNLRLLDKVSVLCYQPFENEIYSIHCCYFMIKTFTIAVLFDLNRAMGAKLLFLEPEKNGYTIPRHKGENP